MDVNTEDWRVMGKYKFKDDLAIDTETNLMWLRFAYGQTWQNGRVQGQAQKISWSDAIEFTNDFNKKAHYSDWRLPSINELISLVDENKEIKGNYLHPTVFPRNNEVELEAFWVSDYGVGWYACFDNGGHFGSGYRVDGICKLRLVRSGQ